MYIYIYVYTHTLYYLLEVDRYFQETAEPNTPEAAALLRSPNWLAWRYPLVRGFRVLEGFLGFRGLGFLGVLGFRGFRGFRV